MSFHGGDTFSGGLTNFVTGITINSYGTGQPTISSGNSTACMVATSIASITINNIICTGGGNLTNTTDGIDILNNTAASALTGPTITNTTVSGYGRSCIFVNVLHDPPAAAFNNSNISNNTLHDCTGNHVTDPTELTACLDVHTSSAVRNHASHVNTTISNNVAFNCLGTAGSTSANGFGIAIINATSGTISNNVVHNTGTNSTFGGAGPVGLIWSQVDGFTISFNEVYDSHTGGSDGEAMNCAACTNSIVEYNYLHGQSSGSYFLVDDGSGPNSNNTFRFNIFEVTSAVDSIHFSLNSLNDLTQNVYNNTFNLSGGGGLGGGCSSTAATAFTFANNIFYSSSQAFFTISNSGGSTCSFSITGNDYFNATGTFSAAINGTPYTSLAAFQTAGFEKVAGNPVGTTANPNLTGSFPGGTCGGYSTTCPAAYKLTTSSPAGSPNGLNLNTLYNCTVGGQDFYGSVITASTLPIGAHFGPGATAGGVPDGGGCIIPYVGIGDAVASANFYVGLRAYSFATQGNKAVNLRRSSDSHTCDINTSSPTGNLGNTAGCSTGGDNGQSVASFCNATSCFATELYDQTGNAFNFIQATAANQPQFILSCINFLPCLRFTAGTTFMSSATKIAAFPYSVGVTAERTGNTTNFNDYLSLAGNGSTGHQTLSTSNVANSDANCYGGGSSSALLNVNDNVWHAIGCTIPTGLGTPIVYADGASASDTNSVAIFTTNGPVLGGDANGSPASSLTGNLTEAFGYSSVLSGASETLLCRNSQTYYNSSNFGGTC